jgi:hypothetical protein
MPTTEITCEPCADHWHDLCNRDHCACAHDGHPSDVQRHAVSDIPIKPHETIPDAWNTWCKCGWGATCDSPEAAAMGLGWHLFKVGMDEVAISRAGYYLGVS